MIRKLITITIILVITIMLFMFGCRNYLVNTTTFQPTRGCEYSLDNLPVPVEHYFITTSDQVKISAFYLPRENCQRAILFIHGNAGNASHRIPDAWDLWDLDANVLLLDYRGYGLSEGKPTEKGIYLDGAAGLDFLIQQKQFEPEHVILYGRSLGCAVAVELAAKAADNNNNKFAGILLATPFTSGRDMADAIGLGWLKFMIGNPFDTYTKIQNVKCPVMIIHGDKDEIVPYAMGKRLCEQVMDSGNDCEFVTVPGAGHNDLTVHNPELIYTNIRRFLDMVTPPSASDDDG